MYSIVTGVFTAAAIVVGIRQMALRAYRAQGWTYLSFRPLKWKVPLLGDKPILLDEQVEFDQRHGHYLRISEVIITLSAASIAFIPQLHVPIRSSLFAYCLVLLGEAVLLCVLFMVLLTYFYESSLYAPAAYTASRSAWVNGVGFGGLFCFGIAYLLLACQIGWAIANGALASK